MQDFHKIKVWQKAHALVLRVYAASSQLPPSENFGLSVNLRRSATAIARFIAEGSSRDSNSEFAIDLKRARAAAHDLEYTLLLCLDLGFFPEPLHAELLDQLTEVGKMTSGLLRSIAAPAEPVR